MSDVIITGGSFAGLAAALQLGRARRKVTVLDTGLPRYLESDMMAGLVAARIKSTNARSFPGMCSRCG